MSGERVLIVDDHKLFAEAVRTILSELGMEVLDLAATARQALEIVNHECPDLILVDLGLPDAGGIEVGKRILQRGCEAKIVAVTALNDPRALREVIRAGFHGYLTKDLPLSQFVEAIKAALGGQIVVPQRLRRGGAARTPEDRDAALLAEQLTARERQVLVLLVEGAGSGEIARRLTISSNTVRTHIQSILAKLQVHSRLEAVAFAVRHGLVKVDEELDDGEYA